MTNTETIQKFYEAFASGDAESMVACYAPDVVFEDPAFGVLQGEEAGNMWRMLLARSKGQLQINYDHIQADEKAGTAQWTARYIFTQTGRPVVNKIKSKFVFDNGLIQQHTDHFDLWKWSRQALGWKGYLLGWTDFMKHKIQKQTRSLLAAYGRN